ncbi:MAG TPA: transporter [Fibrobacteria bacterium]|nr:transporter [Fibrobacteria bacterium]
MLSSRRNSLLFAALVSTLSLPAGAMAQALETEESAPLHQGQIEIGAGLEHQVSSEGTETALPMAFEVGLTEKLTLLVEPVAFTWIRPDVGRHAFGIGDLEASLFYQVLSEQGVLPAVSIAGEVKFPTATNTLIGSGKFDYTPFLVVSKTTGNFFTSINLGYTFIGKPRGVVANDLVNFAIGTIFQASERNRLYAEVYGNTAATSPQREHRQVQQNFQEEKLSVQSLMVSSLQRG